MKWLREHYTYPLYVFIIWCVSTGPSYGGKRGVVCMAIGAMAVQIIMGLVGLRVDRLRRERAERDRIANARWQEEQERVRAVTVEFAAFVKSRLEAAGMRDDDPRHYRCGL